MSPEASARTVLRHAALVLAGGTVGTAGRLALGLLMPEGVWAVLLANVVGALLLGVLVARLPQQTGLRVFLGTGALGGFTTYSALTVGAVELWQTTPLLALGYAVGSVALGLTAALAGLLLGRQREAT